MEINDIYLKDLKVDNYKSLKDSPIELQMGLNIIIGKNGAGKSNLLDFIDRYVGGDLFGFSSRSINTNFSFSLAYLSKVGKNIQSWSFEKAKKEDNSLDHKTQFAYELILNKTENSQLVIENKKMKIINHNVFGIGRSDEKTIEEFTVPGFLDKKYVTFEIPNDAYWVSRPNRLTIDQNSNFEEYSSFSFFKDLEITIERDIAVWINLSKIETKLNVDFFKDFLIERLEKNLDDFGINIILSNYTPITKIRFNPNLNIYSNEESVIVENLSIDFLIDGDWMPWSYLSDGTKRLFYLVSECLTINQGIILIEEPELGIHPHQLLKILDFLKEQSRTKQIIISTHSPLALDVLKEDELDRIIIAKYEKGTRFSHLSQEEIVKAKKYMNELGELSYYWLHSDLEK